MKLARSRTSALLRCAPPLSIRVPFCSVECKLGGTVGDIESAPFVEAMRQFQFRVGHENFALIHVSLVPDMHGEQKTKPTQTTVHALRGLGLLPDLVRVYEVQLIPARTDA
jgi:CTP synthase (UTP-ammonia lyase)